MFRHQAVMLGEIVCFDRQIVPIHRLCAQWGAEEVDEGLGLVLVENRQRPCSGMPDEGCQKASSIALP
jgi:hypothetical protein